MSPAATRNWVTAGVGNKGAIRRWFAQEGITYTEHGNWLTTTFVYYGTPAQHAVLRRWVLRVNGGDRAA